MPHYSENVLNKIQNKRVCIVGPANYLNDLNYGKDIDKYDTIIRFNKGYNLTKNPERFGSRTDVLYHCVCQSPDNGGPISDEMIDSFDIVFSYPQLSRYDNTSFIHGNIDDFNKLPTRLTNKNIVDKQNYIEWERNIGCRPNTGIIAILDILNMNPAELYVTGFTLFKDGYSKLYRDKIDNISVTEENSKFKVLDRMFNSKYKGAHDQYLIYLYLKNHLLNNSKVKMDRILIDILNFDERKYSEKNNLLGRSSRELFIHYLYYD